MKIILILVSVVAIASICQAGVGVTTPEIEAAAYRLWNKFCEGQSEGGNDEGIVVFCKRPRGKKMQTLQHNLQITPGENGQDQVVFVQPPSYHYKHDVIVSGGGVAARKTVIYVKPAKNTHEVVVQDKTTAGEGPSKPQLFFLKGNHGKEATTDIGSVPVNPNPTYLPPTQKPGYNYGAKGLHPAQHEVSGSSLTTSYVQAPPSGLEVPGNF